MHYQVEGSARRFDAFEAGLGPFLLVEQVQRGTPYAVGRPCDLRIAEWHVSALQLMTRLVARNEPVTGNLGEDFAGPVVGHKHQFAVLPSRYGFTYDFRNPCTAFVDHPPGAPGPRDQGSEHRNAGDDLQRDEHAHQATTQGTRLQVRLARSRRR